MNFKRIAVILLLLSSFALAQEKIVSIPESQLTEQQKAALKLQQVDTTVEKAHGWVGIGKELGQAFDGALGSLTQRSNEFAVTPVGKFTMFIVAWKVMGEQAATVLNAIVHILGGFVELAVFLPVFLWSYRRSCMDRRVCISREGSFLWGKRTYQVVENGRANGDDVPVVQIIHWVACVGFVVIWLFTVFSY